jgi:membrane-associated protein
MELIRQFIDLVLHLDKRLDTIIETLGPWAYVILFLVIFCETGLVVTPILPGDSLLFAVGAIAASGRSLDITLVIILLIVAALLGDNTNYWIGRVIGPKIFKKEDVRFLNKKHLERTHDFYERYGGKTIIMARFVPIVRTFAPFVAGLGRMRYFRFLSFSVGGGLLWIVSLTLAGYFFGNLSIVKNNFTFVIFAIVFISILPAIIEFLRERKRARLTAIK